MPRQDAGMLPLHIITLSYSPTASSQYLLDQLSFLAVESLVVALTGEAGSGGNQPNLATFLDSFPAISWQKTGSAWVRKQIDMGSYMI